MFLEFQWSGSSKEFKVEPEKKNEFLKDLEEDENDEDKIDEEDSSKPKSYKLDEEIKTWSDYRRLLYHPKTCLPLNYRYYSDSWLMTSNDAKSCGFFEDFEDKIRFYAEECDFLQGFNLITEFENGFGGISSSCLEYLSDEFGGKEIASFLTAPPTSSSIDTFDKKINSFISTTLSLDAACEFSSFVLPFSLREKLFTTNSQTRLLPHLTYDASNFYQSSAVLAAAFEAVLLPCRTHKNPYTLNYMTQTLVQGRRKILSLRSSLPITYSTSKDEMVLIDNDRRSLTPNFCDENNEWKTFAQFVSLTGTSLMSCKDEYFDYCSKNGRISRNLNSLKIVKTPLKLFTPFPDIFTDDVNYDGRVSSTSNFDYEIRSSRQQLTAVSEISNSTETDQLLKAIVDCNKIYKRTINRSRSADHQQQLELYEEAIERFKSCRQDYGFEELLSDDDS